MPSGYRSTAGGAPWGARTRGTSKPHGFLMNHHKTGRTNWKSANCVPICRLLKFQWLGSMVCYDSAFMSWQRWQEWLYCGSYLWQFCHQCHCIRSLL